jgi:Putative zinc-finger
MSAAACASPLRPEALLDYLLGELAADAEERLEDHLFGCASCAAEAERLAGLASALRQLIPAVVSPARLEALESAGVVSEVSPMRPGEVNHVLYPPAGKALVIRLGGAEIGHAKRLDVALQTPAGEALGRFDDVPFDAPRGEVLLACQRHFADAFPRDIVFALEVVSGDERRRVAEYTVLHRLA